MEYTYQAFNNWVLVRVDVAEDRPAISQHDILLPAGAQTFIGTGIVESAGPTCRIPGLGPGVRVLFPVYGIGHRLIGPDRKEYRAILDHQLLGFWSDVPADVAGPAALAVV